MMSSPVTDRQGIDYREKPNVQKLHAGIARNQGDGLVTIQPFSLRALIVCGLIFFFAAFIWSRYGIDTPTPEPASSASVSQTPQANSSSATNAPSAPPEAGASAVVHVVMKNMEFDPPTVEVKRGGLVEWKNEDITPHTATSASFDSASIDPEKSWKHTFGEPGNFPYNCTFHPDMKAVIIVK